MRRVLFAFISLCIPFAASADSPEIRVGLLLAATGPFADFGDDCRRGVEIARAAAPSSVPLRYITEDSQADPKIAVNGFKKLVDEDNVVAVITMRSPIGMSVNPISRNKKIALLGAVGHPDFAPTNEYAFQCWPTTVAEVETLARYVLSKGQRKLAMITMEDEWTLSLRRELSRIFTSGGGTVVVDETVLPGETEFSSIFTKLKAADVDAAFINLGASQGAAAMKRLHELKFGKQIYSNFWIGDPHNIKAAGSAAVEGVVFPEVKLALPKFQEAAAKILPPKRPSGMTFSCYTAGALVNQALGTAAAVDPPGAYKALLGRNQIELLDGPFRFSDRRGEYPVVMKIIENGIVRELP